MDNLLKKAGALLPHLPLLEHMAALRGLLLLAAYLEERGDRALLVSPERITLVGAEVLSEAEITTSKGATVGAASAYAVLRQLKGHDAPEYAVTREELAALNAGAVSEIEGGEALAAFGETLRRIAPAPEAAAEAPADAPTPERRRGRAAGPEEGGELLSAGN